MTEAAYRYARHEPGVDVVLFGTGDAGHLRSNVAALLEPPLPEADREKLAKLFGHLTGIGLDRIRARARSDRRSSTTAARAPLPVTGRGEGAGSYC